MTDSSTENVIKTNKKAVVKTAIGVGFVGIGLILLISFVSFLNNWQIDQSQLTHLANKQELASNIFGKA